MTGKRLEQLVALGALLLFFGLAAWDAADFRGQARTFPLTVGLVVFALVVLEAALFWRRAGPESAPDAVGEPGKAARVADEALRGQGAQSGLVEQFRRVLPYLLWLLGLYATIYLLGMVVACGLFAGLFLQRVGKLRWHLSLAAGLGTVVFLLLLGELINLRWPDSLLDVPGLFGLEL